MRWLDETHGVQFELIRHFLRRLLDGEWSSAPGQWRSAAIGLVSLFLPAGLLLVREGSLIDQPAVTPAGALSSEISLLTVLLSITGLIALLEWQSLFPTGRDYLAMASFPVRSRQIFTARLASVLLFSAVVVAALILLPSLIAPIEFGAGWRIDASYLHQAAIQAVVAALGCFFVFFAILALQGILLNILPATLFARLSVYVQGGLVAVFLLAAIYSCSIKEWTLLPWLPPVWFTGLHRALLSDPDPFFHAMAARALHASVLAGGLSLLTYVLAYRRYRRLLLESPVRLAAARIWRWTILHLLARSPRRAAIMDFLAKTLARSRTHRLLWMVYLGAALAVVLNSSLVDGAIFNRSNRMFKALEFMVHFWPIACSFVLINGFRHVLSVPCELRANWIFQISESQGRAEWMSAVERFVVAYAIAPLYLVFLPVSGFVLGWPVALRMTLLQLVISLTTFELLFYSWQKLPFTCSYVPGDRPLVTTVSIYFVVLTAVAPILSLVVAVASRVTVLYLLYLANFGVYYVWLRRRRREGWGEARLLYEDLPAVVTDLGIKELTYAGTQAQLRRVAAGDAGHADSEDPDSRTDARLRDRGVYSSDLPGRAAGGGGSALSGAAPPGSPRPALVGVGSFGEQSPREILPPDPGGAHPPGGRDGSLAPHGHGHRQHYGAGQFLTAAGHKLRALFRRRQLDRDLEDELAFHLAMREDSLRQAGAADAPQAARRQVGNLTSLQEACREAWTWGSLERFWQDVRYACRQLRANRGFSIVAALTLSLGIAAPTTIYSMCDAMVWKSLSFPGMDRVVAIFDQDPSNPHLWNSSSPADVEDIRQDQAQFSGFASWENTSADILDAGGEPLRVSRCGVTANFFDVIQVVPALGRGFLPGEDQPGHEREVVLEHRIWHDHFQSDPAVLGRTLRVDAQDYTIVGVMPPHFSFPRPSVALWTPLVLTPQERHARQAGRLFSVARLLPGHSLREAESQIQALAFRLEKLYPQTNTGRRFLVWPVHRFMVGDYMVQFTGMLLGAALFVLLIACVNVANLQFARGTVRRREIALRQALGAGRWRIVAQLLTETLILSLAGAGAGILLARFGLRAIRDGMPAELQRYSPGWSDIGINPGVLAFAIAMAVAGGIVAGVWPALRSSRLNLTESLKEGALSPGGVPWGRRRIHSLLLTAEIALSVVLLVGAVLMISGFRNLLGGDTALDPATLLTFRVDIRADSHRTPAQLTDFYKQALARVGALPGVQSAAVVSALPFSIHPRGSAFRIPGREVRPGKTPTVQLQSVSSGYFGALHIPLRAGRLLSDRDGAGAPLSAVISEEMARQFWAAGASPIGRQVRLGPPDSAGPEITIVGVVGGVRSSVMDRTPGPTLYIPYAQSPEQGMDFAVRAAREPLSLAAAVRSALKSVDPEQPVTDLMTLDRLKRNQAIALTYIALLMGIFGAIALAMAWVGVYGMTAYLVSQQTHEIGVRMALGATAGAVLRALFRRGSRPAVIGIAIGLVLAFGLARVLATVIWGVSAADPGAFAAVPLLMLLAAALAIYLPARRAVLIDPAVALRHE